MIVEDWKRIKPSDVCFSAEVNLNYGRIYMDVKKQYLKLLSALVSKHLLFMQTRLFGALLSFLETNTTNVQNINYM